MKWRWEWFEWEKDQVDVFMQEIQRILSHKEREDLWMWKNEDTIIGCI